MHRKKVVAIGRSVRREIRSPIICDCQLRWRSSRSQQSRGRNGLGVLTTSTGGSDVTLQSAGIVLYQIRICGIRYHMIPLRAAKTFAAQGETTATFSPSSICVGRIVARILRCRTSRSWSLGSGVSEDRGPSRFQPLLVTLYLPCEAL